MRFLLLLAGLKLLELRAGRDRFVAVLLGAFLVLANLLYDSSGWAAGHLAGSAILLAAALVAHADEGGGLGARGAVATALGLLGRAVPLTLVVFLLFPRLSGRLWGLPADAYRGLTGLSEVMAPGSIAEVARSEAVAFRVEFAGPLPGPGDRYWRGPVLDDTDGVTWRGSGERGAVAAPREPTDGAVAHTVALEPHGARWLLGLDAPVTAPDGATLTDRGELRAARPVREPRRYTLWSVPPPGSGAPEAEALAQARRLPPVSVRVQALAARWREGRTEEGVVAAALTHFRQEPFVYTLAPPLLGPDPVDEFLFETRAGFCEHYAAAFTVLLRAADVPARVVTGYLGGELNPLGPHLVVRQSHAHAWSEVWLAGRGWVRVDPTAAVAPERVERAPAAVTGAAGEPVRFAPPGAGLRAWWAVWDATAHGWNRWVVGYDTARQRDLLARLGYRGAVGRGLVVGLAVAAGLVLAGLALAGSRGREEPGVRLYRRYCRRFARRGLSRRLHEGPDAFAQRISAARPDLARAAAEVAAAYGDLRYGPPGPRGPTLRRLRRAVRAVRP